MPLIVQKFGGTSVGDIEKIKKVVQKIRTEIDTGNKVVAVVSAMSGVTNKLINLVKNFSTLLTKNNLSEYDNILSTGEQVTSGLVALQLQTLGYRVRSLLGWQLPLITDNIYSKAKITSIDRDKLLCYLKEYDAVIFAGFQGINLEENRITTLGRGGSDTSAVAVAATINALRCDIYTDVEGVYTADPRIIENATKLNKISYEEMLEMSYTGSKVLETRSVAMAMYYNVKVRVLSSFLDKVSEDSGTILINNEEHVMEKHLVTSISCSNNETRITFKNAKDYSGLSADLFGILAENKINVDMIIQNITHGNSANITFTIKKDDLDITRPLLVKMQKKISAKDLIVNNEIAKISVIGVGMISNYGVAYTMFDTLAKERINILAISTSEIKISVLISKKYAELATRLLHDAYELGS